MSDETDAGGVVACIEVGHQVEIIVNEDGSDSLLYVDNNSQIITKPRLDFVGQRSTFTWKNEQGADFTISLHNDSIIKDAVVGIEKFSDGQPLTLQNQVRIHHMNHTITMKVYLSIY